IHAAPARAQGFVAPSLGVVFANPSAQGRADFGVDLGWLPSYVPVGIDLDVVYAPSFFGNQGPYGQNSVTTVMGNVMIAGGGRGVDFGAFHFWRAGLGLVLAF